MDSNFLKEFSSSRANQVAVTAILVFLALFLLVSTIGASKGLSRPGGPATDTITVSGAGQATMAPDVARITFTVQNKAATVAAAQKATDDQAKAAIEYVQGAGIEDKDIRTLSYTINPEYSYPNPCPPGSMCPAYSGTPRIVGYQVAETVQVTVRDLTKVSDLLGGLGSRQVQNVSGPDFALDDVTAGHNAARADAIEKAKVEAERLAKQLGVRLGKIVNYSESSGGYPYPMAYGMGGAEADMKVASGPVVPAGENTYNASVSITYEIR